MAAPVGNENSQYVQNNPQGCKIKLEEFRLISFGATELLRKVSQGAESLPGEVGLKWKTGQNLVQRTYNSGFLPQGAPPEIFVRKQ